MSGNDNNEAVGFDPTWLRRFPYKLMPVIIAGGVPIKADLIKILGTFFYHWSSISSLPTPPWRLIMQIRRIGDIYDQNRFGPSPGEKENILTII